MTTAFLTHAACIDHVTPPGHPERPDRLHTILAALEAPAFASLHRVEAPEAGEAEILRAHRPEYVAAIRAAMPAEGWVDLDASTSISPGSLQAALRAAGAVVRAVDLVLEGTCQNAFCAVRPPGHHADQGRAMGFCLFNNVAIGALHAIEAHGLERVAVVDFDVHHGNGTQDLFAADPRVLFASTHQMPLFPGTGTEAERGVGNIINVPLAAGDGIDAFRAAFDGRIGPALNAFRPELVMVSAGFDAHADDPLGGTELDGSDFAWITREICGIAAAHASGRLVSTLEGGYSLDALAESVPAHLAVLMEAGGRTGSGEGAD